MLHALRNMLHVASARHASCRVLLRPDGMDMCFGVPPPPDRAPRACRGTGRYGTVDTFLDGVGADAAWAAALARRAARSRR